MENVEVLRAACRGAVLFGSHCRPWIAECLEANIYARLFPLDVVYNSGANSCEGGI